MHVRCPHCHNCIELVDDAPLADILCTSCGSSFNLVDREKATTIDYLGGRRIAHFELIEQLGMGHFGSVWRARDTILDREVALKVPRKDQLDPGEMERFLREARSAAQLRHPHIVQVHEVGRDGDQLYIVSDLVRGATLADWLTGQQLTPREAAELCITLAEALHHAHTQGVVHRDVKPSNIMLDLEGKPYVLDFGLAKREAGEITMTLDGRVLGTPAYMSPEQARGEGHDADARSDVYSLGVILFQLLTGELPFRGNPRMLLVQIQNEEPPSPRKLNAAIPRDLETITLKCLEKSADRRYQTGQALADELRRFVEGKPIHARPISRVERVWRWSKRQPLAASLIVAVIGTLLIGVISTSYFAARSSARAIDLALETKRANDKAREAAVESKRANYKAREADNNAERERIQRERADHNAQLEREQRHRADEKTKEAQRLLYFAHMNLAQNAWEAGDIARVLEILEQHGPGSASHEVRGFEWDYWHRLCHCDLQTLKGHTSAVRSVAFSPDGTRIASGSRDKTVRLWEAATGLEVATLKGHAHTVESVAFSPDGRRIASASVDKTVKIWDTATGKVTTTLQGHTRIVTSVVFSPDGMRIASASQDGTVKLWDTTTGREIYTNNLHALMANTPLFVDGRQVFTSVRRVAFSPDGSRIAATAVGTHTADGPTVWLWDAATRKQQPVVKREADTRQLCFFSPDGKFAPVTRGPEGVKLWSFEGQITVLKGDTSRVSEIAFSPDGTQIVSGGWDPTMKLWDTTTGDEIATLKGHLDIVTSFAFSPDGARIASASNDGTVKLWDASPEVKEVAGARSVALSPDGGRIAAVNLVTVTVWDVTTGHEITTFKGHMKSIRSVAFSPDGTRIASGSDDRTVKLWDAETGHEIATLKHLSEVRSVAFSPDGARIASASGQVKLWDATAGHEIATFKDSNLVASVAFSPNGARIVSGCGDRTAKLWDAATGHEIATLKGHSDRVTGVAFSRDGTRIASASSDKTVKLWNAATGQESATLRGHSNEVTSVAFSPDGARIASGSYDQSAKLWDATTGHEVATLKHSNLVEGVAFSPDGMRIASASYPAVLWDARPLTPEVKAELEAVTLLRRFFSKPLPTSEVRAAIDRDKIISEAAREKALKLADRFKEETDAQKYHDAAWPVIRHPYSNVFVLQFALAQMKAACERAPENATYRIGLGVAQYRLGKFQKERYADALATLGACDQTQPTALAFLVLTQHRLDQKDEAQATLARLRDLMKDPKWANDQQSQVFLREAEKTIGDKPAQPEL